MELDDIDQKILTLIDANLLTQAELPSLLNLDRSSVSRRLGRLANHGFLEKIRRDGITTELHVTAQGKLAISPKNEAIQAHAHELRGGTPPQAINEPLKAINEPTLRLHALKVKYPLFRTAYSSIEAILQEKGYQFSKSGNKQVPTYEVQLTQDIHLQITRSYINAFGPQQEAPISLPTELLETQALRANTQAVAKFIENTGIRVQRMLNGSLIAQIRYKEIAQTSSQLAHEVSKDRGYVVLAVDQEGKPIAWTDHSDTWEFESSDSIIVEEARKWTQAIKDGEIHPYADSIEQRRRLEELHALIEKEVEATSQIIGQQQQFATNLQAHANAIINLNAVLAKLDAKLDTIKSPKPSLWQRLFKRKSK